MMNDDIQDADQRSSGRRRFLGGAGLAIGAAGAAALLPATPASATPGNFGKNLRDDFGAVGNGTTDDTTAIQNAINSLDGSPSAPTAGITGGFLYVPAGEYLITQTITINLFAGIIQGEGRGNLPTYSSSPGKGAAFRWGGAAGVPMFKVTDSAFVSFKDLMFIGNDASQPAAGIEFHSVAGAGRGTNGLLLVEDCLFGVYPWTRQGVHVGHLQNGITFTGANANNDEFRIVRCQFEGAHDGTAGDSDEVKRTWGPKYPDTKGVRIDNTQSVWGDIIDCRFNQLGTALATASSVNLVNPNVNRCNRDFEVNSSARVQASSYWSEWTKQVARVSHYASLFIDGGGCHLDPVRMGVTTPGTGAGKFVDAYPSANGQTVTLRNINFSRNDVNAAVLPTIRFGPRNSDHAGNNMGFHVEVHNCLGITSAQAEFAGTMWASVPESRGVISWHSRSMKGVHQFRNEMRFSNGTGYRNTLNTGVWDHPLPGTV
jgi:hypothetical protein